MTSGPVCRSWWHLAVRLQIANTSFSLSPSRCVAESTVAAKLKNAKDHVFGQRFVCLGYCRNMAVQLGGVCGRGALMNII